MISNGLGGNLTSDLKSATLITLVSMCILPLTAMLAMLASETMAASKQPWRSYELRFEISKLDYPGIHVHIASNSPPRPWWPHKPLRPPNNLGGHMTSYLKSATLSTLEYMCILPPTASEAMAASKQPRRSYYISFEISNLDYPGNPCAYCLQQPCWWPLRPWRPSNDLGGHI